MFYILYHLVLCYHEKAFPFIKLFLISLCNHCFKLCPRNTSCSAKFGSRHARLLVITNPALLNNLSLFWVLLSFFFATIFLNTPQTLLDVSSDLVEAAAVKDFSEVLSNMGSTELTLLSCIILTVACTADSLASSLVNENSLNLGSRRAGIAKSRLLS